MMDGEGVQRMEGVEILTSPTVQDVWDFLRGMRADDRMMFAENMPLSAPAFLRYAPHIVLCRAAHGVFAGAWMHDIDGDTGWLGAWRRSSRRVPIPSRDLCHEIFTKWLYEMQHVHAAIREANIRARRLARVTGLTFCGTVPAMSRHAGEWEAMCIYTMRPGDVFVAMDAAHALRRKRLNEVL